MSDKIQDLPHLYAEGIDYSEPVYPDQLTRAVGELNMLPGDTDFVNKKDETISLYRGDSVENLEEMGFDPDTKYIENSALSREFPIYFTTSEEEAIDQSLRKRDTDDHYVIEIEVPFESLGRIGSLKPIEVATNYEDIKFESDQVYFNQSNRSRRTLEWIGVEIPEKWVQSIDQLDEKHFTPTP